MKNFRLIYLLIILISFSACEEEVMDYRTTNGPFAVFYPTVSAIVTEQQETMVTIVIEATGVIPRDEIVYVKVPSDPSIITDPPYDPFTKEVAVLIERQPTSEGNMTPRQLGQFTFQYKDNDYENPLEYYHLEVVRGSNVINGGGNTGNFIVRVIDDDFTIFAPFNEEFNEGCADLDNAGLPRGWEAVSIASAAEWNCSGNRRGASGDDNDYGIEMDNYLSDEAADDWLITPIINISEGEKLMSFSSMMRYEGSSVEVLYSTNYIKGTSPETAEWLPLQAATDAFDTNTGSFDYVESGDISLADLPTEFNIAFHYTSAGTQSGQTGTARIDNFEIK